MTQAPAVEQHGPPLRVALLHNIISPHVVPLFRLLAQQPGIDLKVYFLAETDRNRHWATSGAAGFNFEVLPHRAVRVGRKDLHTFFINPTVLSALRRDGFDVVVSAGWDSFAALAAFALCRFTRKPFVLWSGSTANEPSWRRTLTLPLVRLLVRGSQAYLAYGTRAKEYLVHLGAAPNDVHIAYNTVDVEWFQQQAAALAPRRAEIRRELGFEEGPVILFVGQLIERKGPQDLLAAYRRLLSTHPDAQVVLVGYGPLERVLKDEVSQHGLRRVHFPGHVPLSDLPGYYVAADCFVLPSHEEVWGLVLNEAAANGLPLVTTSAVGAGPDLIRPGENGFIVPPGSPEHLAEVLARSLDQQSFADASRQIVSRATYEQNVTAIRTAIREAVDSNLNPRPQ